jgi:hypothetical protein
MFWKIVFLSFCFALALAGLARATREYRERLALRRAESEAKRMVWEVAMEIAYDDRLSDDEDRLWCLYVGDV